MPGPKRGGVVVRHEGALRFLPASVVSRVAPRPLISRVPVVSISDDARADTPLLVCRYLGEPVGIVGCEVVEAGSFDADPSAEGAVIAHGAPARSLDLTATFASLQNARWTIAGEG